jgi:transcriptional regulator GlxA family with amidase domain
MQARRKLREIQEDHFAKPTRAFSLKSLPAVNPARREEILAERDLWLREIDPAGSFYLLLDAIPGMRFNAKSREGKLMLMNQQNLDSFHIPDETALIGLTDFDLSPPSVAEFFLDDDARIYATGKPLLNRVELSFDEQGMPDWSVANKMPIRSHVRKIIGVMGICQPYEQRVKLLSPFHSVSKALSHIRHNYQQDISVDDLVRLVGLSERQLRRKFNAYFGVGPRQFLIKTRVAAACRHLSQSGRNFAAIASECGFTDQSAFCQQFRRYLGMAPHEFCRSLPLRGQLPRSAYRRPALSPPPLTQARRQEALAERNAWLSEIDPAGSFHRMFDAIPGVQFFAKNRQGKIMLVNQGMRDKFHAVDESALIGLTDLDLSPPNLARACVKDDARIYATGKPLLNHVELGFDDEGVPDWSVVNKMPIRSRAGEIIGIMGLAQPYQGPAKLPSPFDGIAEAVSYARQNCQHGISVGGLADLAGLTINQLERKFRACIGIGPKQFLLKSRLLAACRRLVGTDDGVAQIASDCAFTHASAFAHQFRRHFGLTPREFRRQRLAC